MEPIVRSTPTAGDVLAVTTFAGARLLVPSHAVERYQERVKPHLTPEEAASDLCRLIPLVGRRLAGPPPWILGYEDYKGDYIALGPDVVFVAARRRRYRALVTCLTPHMRKGPKSGVSAFPHKRRKRPTGRVYSRRELTVPAEAA